MSWTLPGDRDDHPARGDPRDSRVPRASGAGATHRTRAALPADLFRALSTPLSRIPRRHSASTLPVVTLRVPPSGKIGLHLRVSGYTEPLDQPQLLPRTAKTGSVFLIRPGRPRRHGQPVAVRPVAGGDRGRHPARWRVWPARRRADRQVGLRQLRRRPGPGRGGGAGAGSADRRGFLREHCRETLAAVDLICDWVGDSPH